MSHGKTAGQYMSGRMGQFFVDQRPVFSRKTRRSNGNQVIGRSGIIRPDKRKKVKYF